MDAKSRANFINSVASGASVPCPKCGTSNKPDSKFCISCGAEITVSGEAQNNAPAFAPAQEAPAFAPAQKAPAKAMKYVEPANAFAKGLPDWSIEPPQVMVRRH